MYFFSKHTPRGSLDLQSYALYKAAKGIWNGGLDIHPLELEDPDPIHNDTLLLIANAVLLARYGRIVMVDTQPTADQNEDRRLIAMQGLSIPEKNLFVEKQSGKDFQRSQYKKWSGG